ncbi:hypothetical protein B0T16DRAFT_419907 [Cercophora newfieldiana]|uniref:Uncharacterized protein n=1 Tax=Cercophora newfieldiana TaxID=92897 RepID=A0AA40CL54_9PEZI|nr:hypothetical protein B0T16DRAFT_419907 [Cercophora newfieldiana]
MVIHTPTPCSPQENRNRTRRVCRLLRSSPSNNCVMRRIPHLHHIPSVTGSIQRLMGETRACLARPILKCSTKSAPTSQARGITTQHPVLRVHPMDPPNASSNHNPQTSIMSMTPSSKAQPTTAKPSTLRPIELTQPPLSHQTQPIRHEQMKC